MEVTCPNCKARKRVDLVEFDALSCTVCPVCGALFGIKPSEAAPPQVAAEPLPAQFAVANEDGAGQALAAEDIIVIPQESPEGFGADAQFEVLEDVFRPEVLAESDGHEGVEGNLADAVAASAAASGVEAQFAGPRHEVEQVVEAGARTAFVPARPPAPDGYAVGMRVLRVAPVWLLLSTLGFLGVLLLFNWMSKPVGDAVAAEVTGPELKNAATSVVTEPALVPATQAAERSAEAAAPAQSPEVAQVKEELPKSVEAAPPAPAEVPNPVAAAPVAEGGKFTVQVGSYSEASEANARVSSLRAAGFDARVEQVELPKRGVWHRVQCGRLPTREDAVRLGAELRAKRAADQVIVTEVQK